jgi:ABC-2 type transport system permease protein
VEFIPAPDRAATIAKLRRHQYDMVLSENPAEYWVNASSPKGYLLEKILTTADGGRHARQTVEGREIRYVDWLVAGLLGMNIMFSALFGVGYTIVRYRKNGVLKRLKATPIGAIEFLCAQVISRLLLIQLLTVVVFVGCNAVLRFEMQGSYLSLFIVMSVGSMCLIALALLIAARGASEEFAGGLLNLISWPMMFLSGVWFSLEGTHPLVRKLAQALPLTHLIDASRAIMTEGASLASVSGHLVALVAMSAVFMAAGVALFRWE